MPLTSRSKRKSKPCIVICKNKDNYISPFFNMGNTITKRHQHKQLFMYNVNTGMVPSYIQDFIPPLASVISDYPLRNKRNSLVPLNRTSILQKYCIPSSIRLWNFLEDINITHLLKAFNIKV